MLRFLRRHNRKMLAIFAAFLMAAFLLPPATTRLSRGFNLSDAQGWAFGEEITAEDFRGNELKLRILEGLGIRWRYLPVGNRFLPGANIGVYPAEPLGHTDYLLLVREARQMGVSVGQEEVNGLLRGMGVTKKYITGLRKGMGIGEKAIVAALADYMSVLHAARVCLSRARVSEPQLRRYVRDTQERVRVRVLRLSTRLFKDQVPKPTEEQLQSQFDRYKEYLPGEEGGLGFGYKYPDRVQVEYLMVDAAELADRIEVGEQRAWEYYQKYRERYRRRQPATTRSTTAASQAASASAESQDRTLSFDEAREQVIKDIRLEQARAEAREIIDKAIDLAAKPWLEAKTLEDGTKEPLDPSQWVDYRQISRELREADGVNLVYHRSKKFLSKSEARRFGQIGSARLKSGEGSSGVSFADYIFNIKPLVSASKDKSNRDILAVGHDNNIPLVAGDKFFLCRPIDVAASQVPAGFDADEELRQRVEEDWVEAQAFEEIAARYAGEVADAAEKVGLVKAAETYEGLKKLGPKAPAIRTPPPFARRQPAPLFFGLRPQETDRAPLVAGVGRSKKFVDKCFELAEAGKAGGITVASLPDLKCFCVIEFVDVTRVREDQYKEARPRAAQQLAAAALQRWGALWFQPENIRKRTGYKEAKPK